MRGREGLLVILKGLLNILFLLCAVCLVFQWGGILFHWRREKEDVILYCIQNTIKNMMLKTTFFHH